MKTKTKFKPKTTEQICKEITSVVIEALEKDLCPWIKPWSSPEGPINYNTKRPYSSSNKIILTSVQMVKGYDFNSWVTFKGAKDLGGNVKKGEKGTQVVFWKVIMRDVLDKEGNPVLDSKGNPKEKPIYFLKTYTVFNIAQCEGFPMPDKPKTATSGLPDVDAKAHSFVYNYSKAQPSLKIQSTIKSDRAYFSPRDDKIVVPTIEQATQKALSMGQTEWDGLEHFYSTLFHEMVHSTGTKDRLNRPTLVETSYFGDHNYSKEELVAEIGSAVLGAKAGVASERVMDNTKAYCKGWASKLKDQPSWILWAGTQSEKATNYILGESQQENK